MGIRIQPAELEITRENPFANDLLGRETAAKVLTQVIQSIDGPCVLSIDGPYGVGKTTFLRLWAQHLKNHEIQVVNLNAWESDFSGDPFLSISQGILAGFENCSNKNIQSRLSEFGQIAGDVAARSAPAIVRVATMGVLDIEPIIEEVTGSIAEKSTRMRIDQITAQRKSMESFKVKLTKLAKAIADTERNNPLVILVDELDRCRPSYAVEMLEVAKHLFSVDGIVFALGVNRSQLSHSVKCLYGQDFDADAYLKRFFDIDFSLPEPDKENFISDLMHRTGIETFFDQTSDTWAKSIDRSILGSILLSLLRRSPLTLRQISQIIHHLGLVFTSLGTEHRAYALPSVMAVILKFTIPDVYHQLRNGNISDSDAVDRLFSALGIPDNATRIRGEHAKNYAQAEAVIAACFVEASAQARQLTQQHDTLTPMMNDYWSSPLISKYLKNYAEKDYEYSSYCSQFSNVINSFVQRSRNEDSVSVGFLEAAERLELLAPSLLTS